MSTLTEILNNVAIKASADPAFFRQLSQNPEKTLLERGFSMTTQQKEELAQLFEQALDLKVRDLREFLTTRHLEPVADQVDWVVWVARFLHEHKA